MTARPSGSDDERIRREAADWFARLRGTPTAADRIALDAWLDTDPAHRAALARIEQRWDQSAFVRNADVAIRRDLGRAVAWHRRPTARAGAVAAAVVAIALLTTSVLVTRPDRPIVEADASGAIANSTGRPHLLRLADGSSVLLQPDTAVAVRSTAHERRLRLLRGTARFSVARDPARLFVVDAAQGSIVARGTIFDVTVDGPTVAVALIEGKVEVVPHSAERDEEDSVRVLRPGQSTSYGSSPAPPRAERKVALSHLREPAMLDFDELPLRDAAAAISRRSATTVEVDAALGTLRVSGAFRADDAPGFAAAVAALFDLRVVPTANGILIQSRKKA